MEVSIPETAKELVVHVDQLIARFPAVVITSQVEYTNAATELVAIKQDLTRLEAARTAITGPINKGLDAINAFFRGPKDRLTATETRIKTAMQKYIADERAKAAEAQRILDEAAAKERARVKALADAAAAKAAQEAAEARARQAKAEAEGRAKEAAKEAARAAAIEVKAEARASIDAVKIEALQAPQVAPVVAKVAGVSTRKVKRFEIIDPALVPDAYKVISSTAIGTAVQAGVTEIPGVRIYEDEVPVASRKGL